MGGISIPLQQFDLCGTGIQPLQQFDLCGTRKLAALTYVIPCYIEDA